MTTSHIGPLLFFLLFCSTNMLARIKNSCSLNQTPLNFGKYDPNNTIIAKLSSDGKFFGQIDVNQKANFWLTTKPTSPIFSIERDTSIRQRFTDVDLSNKKYIVVDSVLESTNLQNNGMLTIIDNQNWRIKQFNTSIFGGTGQSKYAISSSENLLVYVPANSPTQVVFYDLVTERELISWNYNFGSITAFAFHPLEQSIAIKDISGKTIRIIDIMSGETVKTLEPDTPIYDDSNSPVKSLFFWANGTELVSNSDSFMTALSWNLQTKQIDFETIWVAPLPMFRNQSTTKLVIADATASINMLIINDPTVYLDQPFGPFNYVFAAAFSPDDKYLVAGASDGGYLNIVDGDNFNQLCTGQLESLDGIDQIVFVNENEFLTQSFGNTITRWHIVN